MTTVPDNRLKGNYGASYVSALLSSECLVRPVAGDTDVGVDLYCETVIEGKPFLHFWVQVKAGVQCHKYKNRPIASCSFNVSHLKYWDRQPVPVFAALVPVDWPVVNDPEVYVIDITSKLLTGIQAKSKSVRLKSDFVWHPNKRDDIKKFLTDIVPAIAASQKCKNGLIAPIETLHPKYVIGTPHIPVLKFNSSIKEQIRRTAAFSIIFLFQQKQIDYRSASFRRTMASIVEQFDNSPHYENFLARALSYHADKNFSLAVEFYSRAINSIEGDPNLPQLPNYEIWRQIAQNMRHLLEKANNNVVLQTVD